MNEKRVNFSKNLLMVFLFFAYWILIIIGFVEKNSSFTAICIKVVVYLPLTFCLCTNKHNASILIHVLYHIFIIGSNMLTIINSLSQDIINIYNVIMLFVCVLFDIVCLSELISIIRNKRTIMFRYVILVIGLILIVGNILLYIYFPNEDLLSSFLSFIILLIMEISYFMFFPNVEVSIFEHE